MSKLFVKSLIKVREDYDGQTKPSFVRITTITSLAKLNCESIDIPFIIGKFPIKVGKVGSKHSFEWTVRENGFYNQVTLEYADVYSKKSIKIFPNGSVHVTGCCNPKDCKSVLDQLCCILSNITEKKICFNQFRIVMINANFSINMILDLNKVISNTKAKGCIVSFNPETYSAVKIKFSPGPNMKQVTASIFSSGKIIITGAVTLQEIVSAYSFLIRSLEGTHIKQAETIDLFDTFMGFSFSEWKNFLE